MTEQMSRAEELEKIYFLGVSENREDLFNRETIEYCIKALMESYELEGKAEILGFVPISHGFEWADQKRDLKYLGRMTFRILTTWHGYDEYRVSNAYVFPYEKEFGNTNKVRVSLGNGGYTRDYKQALEGFASKL